MLNLVFQNGRLYSVGSFKGKTHYTNNQKKPRQLRNHPNACQELLWEEVLS